jgi:hypothetical protein
MTDRWDVTLIDDHGDERSGLTLSDVTGSLEQPDWRGKLSGQHGNIREDVSLRMENGDDQGRIAHVRFTGESGDVDVYGLSGFLNPSP